MGLTAVAVTDHDTVDGLPEALAAGERLGMRGRPRRGDQPRARPGHHGHARLLPRRAAERRAAGGARRAARRTATSATRTSSSASPSSATPLDPADLAAAAENGAVGRPHIGEAMVRRGYVELDQRGLRALPAARRPGLGGPAPPLAGPRPPAAARVGRPAGPGAPRHHPHRRRRPRAHRARRRALGPRRPRVLLPAARRGDGGALPRLWRRVRAGAHRRLGLPRDRQARRRGWASASRGRPVPDELLDDLELRRRGDLSCSAVGRSTVPATRRGYREAAASGFRLYCPRIPPGGIVGRVEEYMDQDEAGRLINRLRRVEGQSRGLQRMIEEGRPCEEIFTQLAATKAALDRVGVLLISLKMRECLAEEAGDERRLPRGRREGPRGLPQVRALRQVGRSRGREVRPGTRRQAGEPRAARRAAPGQHRRAARAARRRDRGRLRRRHRHVLAPPRRRRSRTAASSPSTSTTRCSTGCAPSCAAGPAGVRPAAQSSTAGRVPLPDGVADRVAHAQRPAPHRDEPAALARGRAACSLPAAGSSSSSSPEMDRPVGPPNDHVLSLDEVRARARRHWASASSPSYAARRGRPLPHRHRGEPRRSPAP